jgi:hypothetical protein
VTSSNPPLVGERKLFSNVTRLGFAAAHDSPSLKIQEPNSVPDNGVTANPSGINGIFPNATRMCLCLRFESYAITCLHNLTS